jgi:iron complex outermembrane receptor protein
MSLFIPTAVAHFMLAVPVQEKEPPKPKEDRPTVVQPAPSIAVPTAEEARKELDRVPGGTNLVTSDEVEDVRAVTVHDVFRLQPGVLAQPRFGSEEARLSIRGSGLQRTFHGRGLKILQDGAPLNLADGGFDFQAIEPSIMRYVEVYRGANALRYGATTLGGAINFIAPTGHDAERLRTRLEGGSFGFYRGMVTTGEARDEFDYFLSLSHVAQEGFRDHAEQSNQRFFGNAGWRLDPSTETRFYVTFARTDSELPGSLTKAQMEDDPTQAAFFNVSQDQKRDFDLARFANKTTWGGAGRRLDLHAYYAWKDLDHPIIDMPFAPLGVIDQVSHDVGVDVRYRSEGELWGRRNRFTLGLAPSGGRTVDRRQENIGGEPGALRAEGVDRSLNLDLYAESELDLNDGLTLVVGVQASYAVRNFQDEFLSDGDDSRNQRYLGVNPKVGLRIDLGDGRELHFNASRSFEPPSFGEIKRVIAFTPGTLRTVDLDEQTATTIEVGSRGKAGRFKWDATIYLAWIKAELLSLNTSGGAPLGTINADKTLHSGIELRVDLELGAGLLMATSYTLNRFRFDESDDVYPDNRLGGIPEHILQAELAYEHESGLKLAATVEWVPSDYYIDHANTFRADAYAVWGARVSWKNGSITAFVEGRNLSDRVYAATTGVVADAGGADTAQFLPGDGRSFYTGVNLTW